MRVHATFALFLAAGWFYCGYELGRTQERNQATTYVALGPTCGPVETDAVPAPTPLPIEERTIAEHVR